MEKPRHDGLYSCVTRVHDSSLSILHAPANRVFFFDVHTVARHGTIFYGILERFWMKGLVGLRMYVYVYIVILYYTESALMLSPYAAVLSPIVPLVTRKNENTVEIRIRFILYLTKVKKGFFCIYKKRE